MKSNYTIQVHGTCISQDSAGILIRGASGAGKSDLALRLINAGAQLVADDQVTLQALSGNLIAQAPILLRGFLEVRGVGIIQMPQNASAPIRLVVDLIEHNKIERLPTPRIIDLAGINIPKIDLWAFELSAVAKVQIALGLALSRIVRKHE